MKAITFAVPCYNSEEYMRHCINTLLKGGEDVEIIIVDDGSTDGTPEIADSYQRRFPSIVKVFHQENGGHGAAVNTGIQNASGMYFMVVDSDDWVNMAACRKLIDRLKELIEWNTMPDLMVCNYIYEKSGVKRKKVTAYRKAFPTDRLFTWNEIGSLKKDQYIIMHSAIFRTQLLLDCGIELPKHMFYVDNIFVFEPMPYVKTLYYMDINLYRYFIGRADQSVNEDVMIKRIDQQLSINKRMIDFLSTADIDNPHLMTYMVSYLDIITAISSIMLILKNTEEATRKKEALWRYLKKKDPATYKRLRYGVMGRGLNLPGKIGRFVSLGVYKVAHKIVGFN